MYVHFRNKSTGEFLTLDPDVKRLKHMKARLLTFSRVVNSVSDRYKDYVMYVGILLTYKPDENWKPDDIKTFCRKIRRYFGDALLGYAWVAELHKSGKVHYHVCLALPKGTYVPKFDKAAIWSHGWTGRKFLNHLSGHYLVKYLQKGSDLNGGKFPKGLRMFAVVIRPFCPVTRFERLEFRLSAANRAVRDKVMALCASTGKVDGWKWQYWTWATFAGWGIWNDGQFFEWVVSEWERVEFSRNDIIPSWWMTNTPRQNYALSIRKLYRTVQNKIGA